MILAALWLTRCLGEHVPARWQVCIAALLYMDPTVVGPCGSIADRSRPDSSARAWGTRQARKLAPGLCLTECRDIYHGSASTPPLKCRSHVVADHAPLMRRSPVPLARQMRAARGPLACRLAAQVGNRRCLVGTRRCPAHRQGDVARCGNRNFDVIHRRFALVARRLASGDLTLDGLDLVFSPPALRRSSRDRADRRPSPEG